MERDFRRSPPAAECILQLTSLSSGGTCSLTGGWRGVSLATSFLRGLVLSSPLSGVSFLTSPVHHLLRGHSSYLSLLLLRGTGLTSFSSPSEITPFVGGGPPFLSSLEDTGLPTEAEGKGDSPDLGYSPLW